MMSVKMLVDRCISWPVISMYLLISFNGRDSREPKTHSILLFVAKKMPNDAMMSRTSIVLIVLNVTFDVTSRC